ncbi:glyoxalase/bleomycin resistance/dioxygenase family protein [Paenibacillaceae bacterium]|nr:glyoxalase/bleomycin resistance/dioxygenase family protein [Paenibacillaceae bacterium]
MNIHESGVILFMENYAETLDFYLTKLGLPVREQKDGLTIFDFGKSYLMIENNGVASTTEKTRAQNPSIIRFDVTDFDETIQELVERGLEVTVHRPNWGTIGVIIDPEGNRIEIKAAE